MISEFKSEYRFLSNFYPCNIELDGKLWTSTEHYYAAMKNSDPAYQEGVRNLSSPAQAKKAGQLVVIREDWEQVKQDVMLKALRAKFAPGSDLAVKLLATGYKILQEGNRWNDMYWGVCLNTGVGQNHLGKLLMQVRTELRGIHEDPDQF